MIIMHLINNLGRGGAEKLLLDIMENTQMHPTDKLYLCIINNNSDPIYLNRAKQAVKDRLIEINKNEGSKNPIFIHKLAENIKKVKADIVHVHNKSTRNYALIIKLVYCQSIKIVYTLHSVHILPYENKFFGMLTKKFVSCFIAVSKSIENEIKEARIEKYTTILNSIKVSDYTLPKIHHHKKNICCIGRINPEQKGQDILLNALGQVKKKYKNFQCYFVGDASYKSDSTRKKVMDDLQGLVGQMQLEKNIAFTGVVHDIPKLLQYMDILVLPSRYEGFGLVIVEAMASKTLAIASDIDGPKEIIGENLYGYLFKCGDENDLAKKIEYVLTHDNSNIIGRAFDYVSDRYDIKRMVNQYYDVYETLHNIGHMKEETTYAKQRL